MAKAGGTWLTDKAVGGGGSLAIHPLLSAHHVCACVSVHVCLLSVCTCEFVYLTYVCMLPDVGIDVSMS